MLACVAALSSGCCLLQSPSPSTPTLLRGPPEQWELMSKDERGEHMVASVMPTMGKLFEGHDPARYSDFACTTCHGGDAMDRGFAMPNPSLPSVYPLQAPERQQSMRDQPNVVRFMSDRVVPTMATLLQLPASDSASENAVSCFSCHPLGQPAQAYDATIQGS